MAFQIPRPHQSSAGEQAQQTAENELEILNPEREVTLGGKAYTVREYSHLEWLKLLYKVEPLVALVHERIVSEKLTTLSTEDVLLLVSEHHQVLLPAIAQAAGISDDELEALESIELQALISTWWGVNYRFFLDRATERELVKIMEWKEKQLVQLALAKPTPP